MGKETRLQRQRVVLARQYGAHQVTVTAQHGYARFASPNMAQMFASELDNVDITVYGQGYQTAVDWTVTNRYAGNKQVER